MLRIAICDDNSDARFALRTALERVTDARSISTVIYEFSSGENVLKWLHNRAGETDILFLDIEMDGIDGMDTARRIRQSDSAIVLIFVTGYSDYVFDGYSVGALDYIMKPADEKRIDSVLSRAIVALHIHTDNVFVCKNADGIYRIPKSSILYFYSDRRIITCVSREREYSFYGKLDEIQGDMGNGFIRIHQRYLINAANTDRLSGGEALISGTVLPVSRAYRQSSTAAFVRTLMEG